MLGSAALVALAIFSSLQPKLGLRSRGDFWLLVNLIVATCVGAGWLLAAVLRPAGTDSWNFTTAGLATWGVLAGVVMGVWIYTRLRQGDLPRLLDAVFVVVPVCHGLARLGCFLAGCCYGRPAGVHLPWAVTFTDPRAEIPSSLLGIPLHPTQLYEAAGDLLLAVLLGRFFWQGVLQKNLPPGSVCLAYFAGYGLVRFVVDFFRGDGGALPGLGLSLAQAMSVVAMGLAAGMWHARRREGAVPFVPP